MQVYISHVECVRMYRQLYHREATVILGCRSKTRALDAMRTIDPKYGNKSNSKCRMYYINIDLTSIASIHEAVQVFQEMDMPLHILCLNAGVMRNKREETVDGLEMTMAANVSIKFKMCLHKIHDTF